MALEACELSGSGREEGMPGGTGDSGSGVTGLGGLGGAAGVALGFPSEKGSGGWLCPSAASVASVALLPKEEESPSSPGLCISIC